MPHLVTMMMPLGVVSLNWPSKSEVTCYWGRRSFSGMPEKQFFRTHSLKRVYSLIIEMPEKYNVYDSSIISPYPKQLDDIVDEFSNEYFGGDPEEYASLLKEVQKSSHLRTFFSSATSISENSISATIAPEDTGGSMKILSGLPESLDASLNKAQNIVRSAYDGIFSSISESAFNIRNALENNVRTLLSSIYSAKDETSSNFAGLINKLDGSIDSSGVFRQVIVIVDDYLINAVGFLVNSYTSVKLLLPSDVRNTLNLFEDKAVRPFALAFQQLSVIIEAFKKSVGLDPNDPIIGFIVFLGTSGTIGISYWLFKYGGYSGDLSPDSTFDLLRNEQNAVLIDIRPEDLRERDGIPDLRRAARSKYASVTLPEVDGLVRKLLKSGRDVDDALVSIVIRNLKIVKNASKVVIMDASGNHSKAIARSLKKLGVKRPYLVQGGFRSWVKSGLRIKELKSETALNVLSQEAEAILEEIRPTPSLVAGYILGISAAFYALIEWEKTLQIIGIIGLGQTLYRRFASYEDSKDFIRDTRFLLSPLILGAQAISWVAQKFEPNKNGLPISPSSTVVHDRVLQAAAKHESQPSDAEDSLTSGNLDPS